MSTVRFGSPHRNWMVAKVFLEAHILWHRRQPWGSPGGYAPQRNAPTAESSAGEPTKQGPPLGPPRTSVPKGDDLGGRTGEPYHSVAESSAKAWKDGYVRLCESGLGTKNEPGVSLLFVCLFVSCGGQRGWGLVAGIFGPEWIFLVGSCWLEILGDCLGCGLVCVCRRQRQGPPSSPVRSRKIPRNPVGRP